jgi:hypothetical protein
MPGLRAASGFGGATPTRRGKEHQPGEVVDESEQDAASWLGVLDCDFGDCRDTWTQVSLRRAIYACEGREVKTVSARRRGAATGMKRELMAVRLIGEQLKRG